MSEHVRDCQICGTSIDLIDGMEWPADESDTYCWGCLWDLLTETRQAIETLRKYAAGTFDYWDRDQDSKVGKRLKAMAGFLEGYDSAIDSALVVRNPPDAQLAKEGE